MTVDAEANHQLLQKQQVLLGSFCAYADDECKKSSCYKREEKEKERVVVIMGATGTGKSKLSIDLATRFSGEVVNSDKIQVYRGLDITTNKMPLHDRRGVPHHLLGDLDPALGELPPKGFRDLAARAIAGIAARRRLPVVAGGSNSFVHAAMVDRYDPRLDPFAPERRLQPDVINGLRYRCCFLWVDVQEELLVEHLDRRVEEMVVEGMVEELEEYFAAGQADEGKNAGLGKAIGVAEFREYFSGFGRRTAAAYEAAVAAIKENTRLLAGEQVRKIERLGGREGWALQRVDATAAVAAKLAGEGAEAVASAWERDVLGPSVAAVELFLEEEEAAGHHHDEHNCRRRSSSIVPSPLKVC